MNINSKFKKLFNSIISKNKSKALLILLDLMYKKKILNKELVLNLIKGLILIFYVNIDQIDIYYNFYYKLLYYITFELDKAKRKEIFNKLKKIKLSLQFNLEGYIIDKIILVTNHFLMNINSKYSFDILLDLWVGILDNIKLLNTSFDFKIKIYFHFIKKINNIIDEDKNDIYNSSIVYMKTVINMINKFI